MGNMKRRHLLVTIGLLGLILVVLLTLLTINRLNNNRLLWRTSLLNQGVLILASFQAISRAGLRHMPALSERRLQYLAEEMKRVGMVQSVFLIDREGRVVIHSDPQQVGQVEPQAERLWAQARQRPGQFTPASFEVVRLFRPVVPFAGRGPWRPRFPEAEPLLGVAQLSLAEYQAARQAEVRQAVGLGVGIFGVALTLVVVLLFAHDRRLLKQLRVTTGHLMEQMPAGLLTADQEGRLLTANLQARTMWLQDRGGELSGRLSQVLRPDLNQRIMDLAPDQSLTELETKLSFGQEEVPVALSAVRLAPSAEDQTAFIILLRDLRQVKELEQRLRRSERLAALGRLSAGVAHEIRNPLSSIRGLAQYLKSRLPEGSDEAGYAGVMIGEADRLNRVVSDLLAYARPKPPRPAPTDLNALVRKVADLVADQAQAKGEEIHLSLDPALEPLWLDEDQMTQVIFNLLLNALESGAGRIEIRTGRIDGQVLLQVADDGPGIDEEDRGRIFDPFFTTKASGSGLGLAISLRIVEEHGGRLTLKDSDQGSLFELALPANQPAGAG
ncbi:MAG: hypothetical protein JRJ59_04615 [Deltaproteobacteria bacterium]|nr:hypothetical protein [Deltaproteobacteria bacterium]